MDEKLAIKNGCVRINVDDGAPPRSFTGEMIHELVTDTKNLIPFTRGK